MKRVCRSENRWSIQRTRIGPRFQASTTDIPSFLPPSTRIADHRAKVAAFAAVRGKIARPVKKHNPAGMVQRRWSTKPLASLNHFTVQRTSYKFESNGNLALL
jgi:hypothetical protein